MSSNLIFLWPCATRSYIENMSRRISDSRNSLNFEQIKIKVKKKKKGKKEKGIPSYVLRRQISRREWKEIYTNIDNSDKSSLETTFNKESELDEFCGRSLAPRRTNFFWKGENIIQAFDLLLKQYLQHLSIKKGKERKEKKA